MDKTVKIHYYNNAVGERKDFELILDSLKNICKIIVFDESNSIISSYINGVKNYLFDEDTNDTIIDVGIFNNIFYNPNCMENIKTKILILNEEWLQYQNLADLNNYDHVIVKSQYAKNLVSPFSRNVKKLPFWSIDRYDSSIQEQKKQFHLAGLSIQKGTESLVNRKNVTVVDPSNRFTGSTCNYINHYLSEEEVNTYMNSHNLHICPSLYEAHGHYMFEGLSCGKSIICTRIPVWEECIDPDMVNFIDVYETENDINNYIKEYIKSYRPHAPISDTKYQYMSNIPHFNYIEANKFPLRKAFIFDEEELDEKIKKHKNDKFSEKRRNYCLDLYEKRKKEFQNFIVDLL